MQEPAEKIDPFKITPEAQTALAAARDEKVKRSHHEFWSVDSAPGQYAHGVPLMRGPMVLIAFVLISIGFLLLMNESPFMRRNFPHRDFYFFAGYQGDHSVSVRIFIISFLISFALFTDNRPYRVAWFVLDSVFSFLAVCALMDATLMVLYELFAFSMDLNVVAIISGILGFAIYSFKLLERGRMPPRVAMEIDTKHNSATLMRVIIVALICLAASAYVGSLDLNVVEFLRSIALLGGIGPGIFLFLPMFFLTLYVTTLITLSIMRKSDYSAPVTVVIPAHNEEHIIGNTLRALNTAAAEYDGRVRVIVANNNSTDDTYKAAMVALRDCPMINGIVLNVTKAGKAHALNAALAKVETEFFIRIDADTLIDPKALTKGMRHFRHPSVGLVGGMQRAPGGGMFDRARTVEVVVKHGFYSVGMTMVNAIICVPGMFSIYRTALPRKLGGFVDGMNGEDTDMSLRVGEMGYRLIVDPQVQYISEVPATYKHMREQRMRWFRSIFHISSRCRDMIYSRHPTVRGKVVLPYMLVNSARRTMMVPLILFGLVEYFGDFNRIELLEIQAILAVAIGAPTFVAVFALLTNGFVMEVLYIPEYIIFRLIRSYFTLESMLSISIRGKGEHLLDKQ